MIHVKHWMKHWRRLPAALALAAAILTALPAIADEAVAIRAEQVPELGRYEARAIVTGTDMRDRPKGFAQCLADVLVKVSGDPALAEDPAAAKLEAEAGTMVASFDYWDRMSDMPHHDDQGSYDRPFDLTARFDPARIDAALRQLGRAPWTDRPVLVPIIHAQGRSTAFDITQDESRAEDMRDALFDAQQKYGIEIAVPTATERGAWRAQGFPATPGRVPVSGSVVFSEAAHGWVAAWHLDWQGRGYDWDTGGVSFDEAFRVAVRGAMAVLSGHGAPHG